MTAHTLGKNVLDTLSVLCKTWYQIIEFICTMTTWQTLGVNETRLEPNCNENDILHFVNNGYHSSSTLRGCNSHSSAYEMHVCCYRVFFTSNIV